MHVPRLCIAGKNDIAIDVLQHALTLVPVESIVACGNLTDSGEHGWQRSFRRFASEQGVPVLELEQIQQLPGLLFLSVEFDRLVKPDRFIDARLYNLHFSLLPRYKGMYTSAWPILDGAKESGVTLHEIDAGIDTGPILAQQSFPLSADLSCEELYLNYLAHGAALVCEHLPALLRGEIVGIPQTAVGASYFSKESINYRALELDLNKTAVEIKRQIQAFAHRRYQLPVLHGQAVVGARICTKSSRCRPGTLLTEDSTSLTIATVDYDLQVWRDCQADLFAAARSGEIERVCALLNNQCYLDERNAQGQTLLMVAAQCGHLKLLRTLLELGGSTLARDFAGRSVWHYAGDIVRQSGLLSEGVST